ncbi:MAG: 7-cyano-7-deazaguanine synthase, partial [Candidatus Nitrosopumilus limneticus]|nr:7-cyano-7-deazaguanine synthase [Candidatus Nitrosopumilus limneticus]
MKKAVIVFSGGVDSVCAVSFLKSKYELYGITFSYGQKANMEIKASRSFAKKLGLKEHKVIDIGFMKNLYGDSNVLTSSKRKIPTKFEYSIVVPIRNAVFLSVASAWAFTLNASLVAYGAHTGDINYPDCRPKFAKKLENAFNEGEIDGINSKIRKNIEIWSPYLKG